MKCGKAIGLVNKATLRKGIYKTAIINTKSYTIDALPTELSIYYQKRGKDLVLQARRPAIYMATILQR